MSVATPNKLPFSKPVVYALAAFCCLCWAGAYVTGKTAIGTAGAPGFGPFRLAFFRFAVAGVLLLLWGWWRDPTSLRVRREDWPDFLRLALLGMCLTYVFNYSGMALTTGTSAALLMATEPVWIALFSILFLKEKLTIARSVGIGAGLLGTIFVILSTQAPGQALSLTGGAMLGNVLIVLSLLFESGAVMSVKRLTSRYNGRTIVTYDFLIGAVMLLPFALGEAVRSGPTVPTVEAWWSFAYLLVPCTLIAYTLWYRLLEVADASEVTVFIFLQPVVGTFLGVVWKGDPFNRVTMAGAVCVLLGMGGILWESSRKKQGKDTILEATAQLEMP